MASSLLGGPSDRWPLTKVVDALVDAARHAGVPGLVWIAGAFYPSLNLNVDLVRGILWIVEEISGIGIPGDWAVSPLLDILLPFSLGKIEQPSDVILPLLFAWPLIWVIYRLIAGLARVSDPRLWQVAEESQPAPSALADPSLAELRGRKSPRLATVWRAGKGLGFVALGLWLMLLGLLFGALLFLVGPIVALVKIFGLTEFSPLFAGLLLPVLFLLLTYAVVLMVLNQLALHSLAHNRRGIASALTHAWRLVRASPMSATRATLVDLLLFGFVLAVGQALGSTLGFGLLESAFVFLLYGFAGVTRAGFWARTYRALGGLSAADRVPGL